MNRPQHPDTAVDIGNNRAILKYFQGGIHHAGPLNNFGIALDDQAQGRQPIRPHLTNLFVTPYLSRAYLTPAQLMQAETETDTTPPPRETLNTLMRRHPRLILLGDPGSGKSTLMQWLLLAFSTSLEESYKRSLGSLVPFLFTLRELHLQSVTTFDQLWQAYLNATPYAKEAFDRYPEDAKKALPQLFNSGQGLLLLDGIDEVNQKRQRSNLALALRDLLQRHPHCRLILTTRIIGFDQTAWLYPERERSTDSPDPMTSRQKSAKRKLLPSDHLDPMANRQESAERELLPSYYLAPFDRDQIQRFCRNWYAIYQPEQQPQQLRNLQQHISQHQGLAPLARTPVLLNLICFIYARRGTLPEGRAELYQRISETYLVGLDQARGLRQQQRAVLQHLDYRDLSEWLGQLALKIQRERTDTRKIQRERTDTSDQATSLLIPASRIRDILQNGLEERGFSPEACETEPDFILDYLSRRSGFLIPRGPQQDEEQYAFSHLSFLEFFAAAELKASAPLWEEEAWQSLRDHANQPWWSETLVLLFEQADNSRQAQQLLQRLYGTPKQPKVEDTKKQATAWTTLAEIIMNRAVRLPISERTAWIGYLWRYWLGHFAATDPYGENQPSLVRWLWSDTFNSLSAFQQEAGAITRLNLSNIPISDLSPLADLHQLKWLGLDNTQVSDLFPLAALHQLEWLWLSNTQVSDLSSLANLCQLKGVSLGNTQVSDISPLVNLEKLKLLVLSKNPINDFSPLSSLHQLTSLYLDNTQLSDLSPLVATLNKLEELWLSNTLVHDISPLKNMEKLNWLELHNTQVSDYSPLAHLTELSISPEHPPKTQ